MRLPRGSAARQVVSMLLMTLMMSVNMTMTIHDDQRRRRSARTRPCAAGFNAISLRLKEMYQMITLGGDAELELVDTLDPFSEVRGLETAPLKVRRSPGLLRNTCRAQSQQVAEG